MNLLLCSVNGSPKEYFFLIQTRVLGFFKVFEWQSTTLFPSVIILSKNFICPIWILTSSEFFCNKLFLQVYETGCQGLVVSAVMDRLISKVDNESADFGGKLIHIFQTGTPQTQALSSMNFPEKKVSKHVRPPHTG